MGRGPARHGIIKRAFSNRDMAQPVYPHLKDAVLDMDEVLIHTLDAFSLQRAGEHYRAVFRFAFYGPDLDALEDAAEGERVSSLAQYPDIEVMIEGSAAPKQQIDELSDCGILGELLAVEMAPGATGNETGGAKWIVTTHCGCQAERIEWMRSI